MVTPPTLRSKSLTAVASSLCKAFAANHGRRRAPLPLRRDLGEHAVATWFTAILVLSVAATTFPVAGAAAKEPGDVAADFLDAVHNPLNRTLEKTVRVVDASGKPVAGAAVTPWAIRTRRGHGPWLPNGYGESNPPTVRTDAMGHATIPFPKYAVAAERTSTIELTCRVSHPNFAESANHLVSVEPTELHTVEVLALKRGALVEVEAFDGERKLDPASLYVVSRRASLKERMRTNITSEGRLRLPRLSPGPALLRLAHLPKDGPASFSPLKRLELKEGEERLLRVAMEPAARVEGRLDSSVPRPVKDGRVLAAVIDRVDGDSWNVSEWRCGTTIREDGSFTLEALPSGRVQVMAHCAGFFARSGAKPARVDARSGESSAFLLPREFSIAAGTNEIVLEMERTADCRILVYFGFAAKPLKGALCRFWPKVRWRGGDEEDYSCIHHSARPGLINLEPSPSPSCDDHRFVALTNDAGRALVQNLPAGSFEFGVFHEGMELPIGAHGDRSVRVDLVAGRQTDVAVRMQETGSQVLGDLPKDSGPMGHGDESRWFIIKPRPVRSIPTQAEEDVLAGVVVDEEGHPLEGVKVDVWTWYLRHEAETDGNGRFSIERFEPGEVVEVEFTKPGYSPSLYLAQRAGEDDWVVVLTQGTWLEGKVLDPEGRPAAGALVRASRGPFQPPRGFRGDVATETYSDQEGRYRLDLEPGQYDVEVRLPGVGVAGRLGVRLAEKEKKPFDIQLTPGVTLEALVRDSITKKPVPGIVLWSWHHPGLEGTSDETGRLRVSGIPEGSFAFGVSAVGDDRQRPTGVAGDYARWWSAQAARKYEREQCAPEQFQRNFDSLSFDLKGDLFRAEIFVEPAVVIKGRVVDPDGKPVSGATVAPAKTGSGNSLTGDTRHSYRTDSQGRFTMKLPAGKGFAYNLIAHDGPFGPSRKWANGAGEPFHTAPGQVLENVELKLTRGAIVRGRVVDASGKPQARVRVQAAAVDMRDNRYYSPTTRTDEAGRYELRYVAPGRHFVQVEPFHSPAHQAPAANTRIVDVAGGEEIENIDFTAK